MNQSGGVQEPAVRLERVSRTYDSGDVKVHALRDVTVEIAPGEWVSIVGPSGSGKTTLLNVVTGLDRVTSGHVHVFGTEMSALSDDSAAEARARNVGIVFQHPLLLPGLTALENVVVAKLPWGRRGALVAEADELLSAVGLAARRDFPPHRLSGGEQQRVAIARALLGGPRLLIGDEPTGNLDSRSAASLIGLIEQLRRERGLTVVVATHDPLVARAADRTLVLADGAVS